MTQGQLFTTGFHEAPRFDGLVTDGDPHAWAVFSCKAEHRYRSNDPKWWRYLLGRVWNPSLPIMGWLCANPSVADHMKADPSVRKMIGFARRHNMGGILLANTLALATPYPNELLTASDPLGPRNIELVRWMAGHPSVGVLVAGWGRAVPAKLRALAQQSIDAAASVRPLHCFGLTEQEPFEPRHPLMLSYKTPLSEWRNAS